MVVGFKRKPSSTHTEAKSRSSKTDAKENGHHTNGSTEKLLPLPHSDGGVILNTSMPSLPLVPSVTTAIATASPATLSTSAPSSGVSVILPESNLHPTLNIGESVAAPATLAHDVMAHAEPKPEASDVTRVPANGSSAATLRRLVKNGSDFSPKESSSNQPLDDIAAATSQIPANNANRSNTKLNEPQEQQQQQSFWNIFGGPGPQSKDASKDSIGTQPDMAADKDAQEIISGNAGVQDKPKNRQNSSSSLWSIPFLATKTQQEANLTTLENKSDASISAVTEENTKPPQSQFPGRTWGFWWSSNSRKDDGELVVSDPGSKGQSEPTATLLKPSYVATKDADTKSKKTRRKGAANIVTPKPEESLPVYSSSSAFLASIQKLSHYVVPSLRNKDKTELTQCLNLTSPHKIRKVVVVGVHGYFPARVFRTIMGEPTGTSIKFANEAAEAVERWANDNGMTVEINKIALEGEGKVLDRVDKLYKILTNWLHLVHEADFVFFATHSQGTPVAVHLLAKLVQDGHVDKKRMALLGMAGVSLGPMPGLDQKLLMKAISSLESASLHELFEFQNPDSFQSQKYIESLRIILDHNVKVTFVGSLNDQLVPLYSATCTHAVHPNIYRAVYIDGDDVSPEFISSLLSVALKLQNCGSTDHGVIREISTALSGSLTGKGHSKIYDEGQVYSICLKFALETTDPPRCTDLTTIPFVLPKANDNPYLLPWNVKTLTVEAGFRAELREQLNELRTEFQSWHPESKPLKELKYRLFAFQAKL